LTAIWLLASLGQSLLDQTFPSDKVPHVISFLSATAEKKIEKPM
jgi:hypothetical protein